MQAGNGMIYSVALKKAIVTCLYNLRRVIMKNWAILFVKTGEEEKCVSMLKEKLDAAIYLPFLPTKEVSYRSKSVVGKKIKLLFPGYVFIQTEIEADKIAQNLWAAITNITEHKDIYRILNYGDNKKDVAMRERERLYWERLFDSDFCITGSLGFIEGDRVKITSGVLAGMENRIKRLNRHNREAVVEVEMMGTLCELRLMLDVVKKVK
jgi:transcriptional antiterminator NusG